MISDKMTAALNDQIAMEGYASFLYLSMSVWCDLEALEGCSVFLRRQADEERMHMLKLYEYLAEMDLKALTPAIAEPPHDFESVQSLFEQVYEHECKVTASINKLVSMALAEGDHSTLNFLQWYVEEQREEEALMRTILDKMKLIGDGPQSLYYIDKEVSAINEMQDAAEA